MADDFAYMSALELRRLIRTKQVSPVAIVEDALARVEASQPILNPFVTVTADLALEAAHKAEKAVMAGDGDGLLTGLPLSVKDLTAVKGVRFTSGSRTLANFIAPLDSPASERVKAHGAAIVGKTTTTEFGCKASSDSPLTGITRNPWNLRTRPRAAPPPAPARASPPESRRSRSGPTAAARSGFRPRSAACSGSRRSSAGSRSFRPPQPRRSPMSARWRARCATPRSCSPPSPASIRATRRASRPTCPTTSAPASDRPRACGSPGARRSATRGRPRRCARSPAKPRACSRNWAARSSWSRRCSTTRSSFGSPSSMPASAPGSRGRSPSSAT